MFGVLFKTDDGMRFRVYQTLDEAERARQDAVCGCGFDAIVFDCDEQTMTFIEFYE